MRNVRRRAKIYNFLLVAMFLGTTPLSAQNMEITNPVYSDDTSEQPILVGDHDWKSQAALGLKYVFSPGAAAKYDVYHIYKYIDVKDIIWNSRGGDVPQFDIIVSKRETHGGFIVQTPDVTDIFEDSAAFEDFENDLENQGFTAQFASPNRIKNLHIKPRYMVIHRAGWTPENMDVERGTVDIVNGLVDRISSRHQE